MSRTARYTAVVGGAVLVAAAAAGVLAEPQVVSLSSSGGQGVASSQGAAVSADGRHVAFTSAAPLAGPGTHGVLQLYVRDRLTGRTLLASATSDGQPASAPVDDPADHRAYAISGDGRFAVFTSAAANLAPDEGDGAARDVFRKDLRTGVLALVSRAPDGAPAGGPVGGDPDISYDGSRVAYETGSATNLWPGDASPASDIVVSDLTAGVVELVSVTSGGNPITGTLRRPAISADGRSVAFEDDTAVAIRNLEARTTVTVADAANPDLSGDGGVVVYESGSGGVARRTLPFGPAVEVLTPASSPSVSADGARVVVQSDVAHPPAADTNNVADVYARRLPGTVERVSQRANGAEVGAASTRPAVSGSGAIVAYDLDDGATGSSLAAGDVNGLADVLIATLPATDATGPALDIDTPRVPAATAAATIAVAGTVTDPSGVAALTVGGYAARRMGGGAFSVEVPLPYGVNDVAVRAVDGAGNVTERTLSVVRFEDPGSGVVPKARARFLTVLRRGRATVARFRLDAGATRVTVRLWRRVVRRGRSPSWTPAGALRRVATRPGGRTALVHNRRLRPDVYQVRVAVVSRGGVAVASARVRVPVPRPARRR